MKILKFDHACNTNAILISSNQIYLHITNLKMLIHKELKLYNFQKKNKKLTT